MHILYSTYCLSCGVLNTKRTNYIYISFEMSTWQARWYCQKVVCKNFLDLWSFKVTKLEDHTQFKQKVMGVIPKWTRFHSVEELHYVTQPLSFACKCFFSVAYVANMVKWQLLITMFTFLIRRLTWVWHISYNVL